MALALVGDRPLCLASRLHAQQPFSDDRNWLNRLGQLPLAGATPASSQMGLQEWNIRNRLNCRTDDRDKGDSKPQCAAT